VGVHVEVDESRCRGGVGLACSHGQQDRRAPDHFKSSIAGERVVHVDVTAPRALAGDGGNFLRFFLDEKRRRGADFSRQRRLRSILPPIAPLLRHQMCPHRRPTLARSAVRISGIHFPEES
jgi:hypothetical protein